MCTVLAAFNARADEGELRFCPVTVKGAQGSVREVPGGVELLVVAAAPEAEAEIRRRAKHISELTTSGGGGKGSGGGHGNGSGGGVMRNCPVVAKGAIVRDEDVAGGSRITMTPKAPMTVAELRAEVNTRYAALPDQNAKAVIESEARLHTSASGDLRGDGLETVVVRTAAPEDGRGEVKDLIVVAGAAGPRIITTGAKAAKPDRRGHVQIFRVKQDRVELEDGAVSVQGDETRARNLFVWPARNGVELFTVGFTQRGQQLLGQMLDWTPLLKLAD